MHYYADIVMDGSKESVNYVYCTMHDNKFATVETSSKIKKAAKKTYQLFFLLLCSMCPQAQNETSSKIKKAAKKTYQLFFLLLCSMCPQAQNITKIGKTFRKIKTKKV